MNPFLQNNAQAKEAERPLLSRDMQIPKYTGTSTNASVIFKLTDGLPTVLAKITNIRILSYSLKGRMKCVDSQTRSRLMLLNITAHLKKSQKGCCFHSYGQKPRQTGSDSMRHPEDQRFQR